VANYTFDELAHGMMPALLAAGRGSAATAALLDRLVIARPGDDAPV
jgi:hypothetical protein